MTNQEILDGNRLISEFMGEEVLPIRDRDLYPLIKSEDGLRQTKYHSSWDWLMPVIEKINDEDEIIITLCPAVCIVEVGNGNKIEKTEKFWHSRSFKGLDKKQIGEVYKAVVFSIKWYNENKNHGNQSK